MLNKFKKKMFCGPFLASFVLNPGDAFMNSAMFAMLGK
jgi:hypothetical protein